MNERKPLYYVSEDRVYEFQEMSDTVEHREANNQRKDIAAVIEDDDYGLDMKDMH